MAISVMKSFCPVHCFHYTGTVCPFCEKDRFASLAKRHVKTSDAKPAINETKVAKESEKSMDEMLNALAAKYNTNKH